MATQINSRQLRGRAVPSNTNTLDRNIASRTQWTVRVGGALMFMVAALFITWLKDNLAWGSFTAWLGLLALAMTLFSLTLSWLNSQKIASPKYALMPHGAEPVLAVWVSTCGEPEDMVVKTVKSLIEHGGYPQNRLFVAIGDDKKNASLRTKLEKLVSQYPELFKFAYVTRSGGTRNKAGNLNNGVRFLLAQAAKYGFQLDYIATQDCDDLAPEGVEFLRHGVSALVAHPQRGFVQFEKSVYTPKGDPFGTIESIFYSQIQSYRMGGNAPIACGSGLIWRIGALQANGEYLRSRGWTDPISDTEKGLMYFSGEGPVEDLATSYRLSMLQHPGLFIDKLGAMGQIAPEDLPNLLKQRLTWCLDTTRLMLGRKGDNPLFAPGLSFGQRLQFLEILAAYWHSVANVLYALIPVMSLVSPLFIQGANTWWIFALAGAMEAYMALHAGKHYASQWKGRLVSATLYFGYVWYALRALTYYMKPVAYKVTRKTAEVGNYWQQALVQYAVLSVNLVAVVYALNAQITSNTKVVVVFFSLYTIVTMAYALRLSWFRYNFSMERALLSKISKEVLFAVLAFVGGYIVTFFF